MEVRRTHRDAEVPVHVVNVPPIVLEAADGLDCLVLDLGRLREGHHHEGPAYGGGMRPLAPPVIDERILPCEVGVGPPQLDRYLDGDLLLTRARGEDKVLGGREADEGEPVHEVPDVRAELDPGALEVHHVVGPAAADQPTVLGEREDVQLQRLVLGPVGRGRVLGCGRLEWLAIREEDEKGVLGGFFGWGAGCVVLQQALWGDVDVAEALLFGSRLVTVQRGRVYLLGLGASGAW